MEPKILSSIRLRILCFSVISSLLVLPPAAFGRNLSSTTTGNGDNSKIGADAGHSSTAPSATGQSSPTKQSPSFSYNYRSVVNRSTTVCETSGRYSSCRSESSPPTVTDMSENSPPTMSDMSETSPPDMSDTNCSDYNGCTNGSIP